MSDLSTHSKLVLKTFTELKEAGFIAFTNVSYGNFFFDIFAVNPETKEMKVAEIVVASEGKIGEKKALCDKLGISFKVLRPERNDGLDACSFASSIGYCFSNPLRIQVLKLLNTKKSSYSDIMYDLNLDPSTSGGKFSHHLRILERNGLIIKEENRLYDLTRKGETILETIGSLEQLSRAEKWTRRATQK